MKYGNGRTCVYAGATGALGRCAVKMLAKEGENVAMVTHSPEAADEIIGELAGAPGKVIAISNRNGDAAVFEEVEDRLGGIYAVINTTGSLCAPVPVEKVRETALNEKLAHQITAPFLMAQAAVPYLKKQGGGRIVFLTSAGAVNGFPGESIQDSIAGGGVISMTKCLARLLAGTGITVNAIARSGMINDHTPDRQGQFDVESIRDQIPVGYVGSGEAFGALVKYLLSKEAGFMTGQILNLNGGICI